MWGPVDLTSDSLDDDEIAAIFLGYDPFWQNWFSSWNDPKANDLVKRANSTLDHAERQALYSELQQYAMDQAPWVTLLNAPATNAVGRHGDRVPHAAGRLVAARRRVPGALGDRAGGDGSPVTSRHP